MQMRTRYPPGSADIESTVKPTPSTDLRVFAIARMNPGYSRTHATVCEPR